MALPGQELAGSEIDFLDYQEVDGINESGQVAFGAQLVDGRDGVFLYTPSEFLLGDVNGDGLVDLLDVQPFIDALGSGIYVPAADINQDGVVNLLDVGPFVDLLTI